MKKENKKRLVFKNTWDSKKKYILKKERKANLQRHVLFAFEKKKRKVSKKRPEVQKFPHTCFKGGHRQRKRRKEKQNTCGKTEKNKKRKKRQQMN